MNKTEFLFALRENLSNLSESDINDFVEYYSEMIDDRIEEGLTEEAAVKDIGTPEEVANRIMDECSIPKLIKAKLTPKHKLKTWEIVLIAAGSPIWLSLLIAAFAVVISLLAALVSVIISFYAAAVSVGASTFAGLAGFVANCAQGNSQLGFAFLGCGIICAGLCILMFIGTNRLTNLIFVLLKKLVKTIKSRLIRKEETV